MRIGIDIDGVLADFVPDYQRLHVKLTGRDTFVEGDNIDPPTWHWPALRGYTPAETSTVWATIMADPNFWKRLVPMRHNIDSLSRVYRGLGEAGHEVYFVTTRIGILAKQQTEMWLRQWVVGFGAPGGPEVTVLIARFGQKGLIAKGLGLDCFIDDNYDNCVEVVRDSPATRTYLLNRRYNAQGSQSKETPNIFYQNATVEERRVMDLSIFLCKEGFVVL